MLSALNGVVATAVAYLLLAQTGQGAAQEFPTRPIQLVVPSAPGSILDAYARQFGEFLAKAVGQPLVIDSRPGAGGAVALESVKKSQADGYTLLLVTSDMSRNISSQTYGLAPVGFLNSFDMVLLVPRSLPTRDLGEFLAFAKSKPKALAYASPGPGSPQHLAAELFKMMTGTDIVHVPYRATNSARTDLIEGQITMMFDLIPAALPIIRERKVAALGTTGSHRSLTLPDVPAISETIPGYEMNYWIGIMAPAETPKPILARLNREINKILDYPDLKQKWITQGAVPFQMTNEDFDKFVRADSDKWLRLIKETGARLN